MVRPILLSLILLGCGDSEKSASSPPSSPSPEPLPELPRPPPPPPAGPTVIHHIREGKGHTMGALAATDRYVYWLEASAEGERSSVLMRAPLDGPPVEVGAARSSVALAVDAEYVYYAGDLPRTDSVVRRRHDAGGEEAVAGITTDHIQLFGGGRLLITERVVTTSKLWRVAAGTEPALLAEAAVIFDVADHGDRLYLWGKFGDHWLASTNADGQDLRPIATPGAGALVAADEGGPIVHLEDRRIVRLPPGGGPPQLVFAGAAGVIGTGPGELYVVVGDEHEAQVVAVDRRSGKSRPLYDQFMFQAIHGGSRIYLADRERLVALPAH